MRLRVAEWFELRFFKPLLASSLGFAFKVLPMSCTLTRPTRGIQVEDSCISLIGSAEGMQRHLSRIVALFPPMDVALGDTDRFMPWTSATQRQADPGGDTTCILAFPHSPHHTCLALFSYADVS